MNNIRRTKASVEETTSEKKKKKKKRNFASIALWPSTLCCCLPLLWSSRALCTAMASDIASPFAIVAEFMGAL